LQFLQTQQGLKLILTARSNAVIELLLAGYEAQNLICPCYLESISIFLIL